MGVLFTAVVIDWYHDYDIQARRVSGLDIFYCLFWTVGGVGGDQWL